jgi:hypothetical protein
VPVTTTVRRNGRVVLERQLKSIAFNVALPDDAFSREGV